METFCLKYFKVFPEERCFMLINYMYFFYNK